MKKSEVEKLKDKDLQLRYFLGGLKKCLMIPIVIIGFVI